MVTETKTMQELHKIRADLYEETKEMSISRKVEYFKKKTDKAKKEMYGISTKQ